MKISVVMACHDAEATVGAAVQSVLDQTHGDLELWVVDDASTDGSVAVVERFDDPRLQVIRLAQNGGPGPARNEALERCTGDWITFLDADDLYHPQRLERLAWAAEQLGHDVILGDAVKSWSHAPPEVDPLPPRALRPGVDLGTFLGSHTHLKAFFSRALLERTGARQPALFAGEDTVFAARLARLGARFHGVRGQTYLYRVDRGSLSRAPEQPERVLAMVALLRQEHDDPSVHAALDTIERDHRTSLYYRRAATLVRQGHLRTALKHAFGEPRLLLRAPLRWVASRAAWARLR